MRESTTQMLVNLYRSVLRRKRSIRSNPKRIERIRSAMLDLLGEEGVARYPGVAHRIQFSGDEMALWYARSDLMAALSDLYGEETAHRRVTDQTNLFKGLVPKSMIPRRPTTG